MSVKELMDDLKHVEELYYSGRISEELAVELALDIEEELKSIVERGVELKSEIEMLEKEIV